MNLTNILFSFEGRINRKPFWIIFIVNIAINFIWGIVFGFETDNYELVALGTTIVLLWPSLAITAKRWHDRNKSACWILINFIPFLGPAWSVIENGFLPGTKGENRYGPEPK